MEVENNFLESLHAVERRFDERLDARFDEVSAQVTAALGMATRNGELLLRLEREITRISTSVNGNGNPGIKARLARLENAVSQRLIGLNPKPIIALLLAPYVVMAAGVLLLAAASGVDLADIVARIIHLF